MIDNATRRVLRRNGRIRTDVLLYPKQADYPFPTFRYHSSVI